MNKIDNYKDHHLILEGRDTYGEYFKLYRESDYVELISPMLENIIGESVIYEHRYKLSKGKVLKVKKSAEGQDIVVIYDSYYRRRISIKNIRVFHPSIIALLKVVVA